MTWKTWSDSHCGLVSSAFARILFIGRPFVIINLEVVAILHPLGKRFSTIHRFDSYENERAIDSNFKNTKLYEQVNNKNLKAVKIFLTA